MQKGSSLRTMMYEALVSGSELYNLNEKLDELEICLFFSFSKFQSLLLWLSIAVAHDDRKHAFRESKTKNSEMCVTIVWHILTHIGTFA